MLTIKKVLLCLLLLFFVVGCSESDNDELQYSSSEMLDSESSISYESLFDNLLISGVQTYSNSGVYSDWTGIRGVITNNNEVAIRGYLKAVFYSGSSIIDTRLISIRSIKPYGSYVFDEMWGTQQSFTSYEILDENLVEDY